jgi:hypothetical protein
MAVRRDAAVWERWNSWIRDGRIGPTETIPGLRLIATRMIAETPIGPATPAAHPLLAAASEAGWAGGGGGRKAGAVDAAWRADATVGIALVRTRDPFLVPSAIIFGELVEL